MCVPDFPIAVAENLREMQPIHDAEDARPEPPPPREAGARIASRARPDQALHARPTNTNRRTLRVWRPLRPKVVAPDGRPENCLIVMNFCHRMYSGDTIETEGINSVCGFFSVKNTLIHSMSQRFPDSRQTLCTRMAIFTVCFRSDLFL
jgi:hypothetical protein